MEKTNPICSIIIWFHHHFYGLVCLGVSKMFQKYKFTGFILLHKNMWLSWWSKQNSVMTQLLHLIQDYEPKRGKRYLVSLRACRKSQHHAIKLKLFKSCQGDHESAGQRNRYRAMSSTRWHYLALFRCCLQHAQSFLPLQNSLGALETFFSPQNWLNHQQHNRKALRGEETLEPQPKYCKHKKLWLASDMVVSVCLQGLIIWKDIRRRKKEAGQYVMKK